MDKHTSRLPCLSEKIAQWRKQNALFRPLPSYNYYVCAEKGNTLNKQSVMSSEMKENSNSEFQTQEVADACQGDEIGAVNEWIKMWCVCLCAVRSLES